MKVQNQAQNHPSHHSHSQWNSCHYHQTNSIKYKSSDFKLSDCALYSGVGVIYDRFNIWNPAEPHLSSLDYKIISRFPVNIKIVNSFATIAQSIAYPKPHASPTVAESSDSTPFVIAVFVSGRVSSHPHTLHTITYGEVNIVDDIIQPFLPQSAPHLQHIPKLFFITCTAVHPLSPPPQFPEDSDGNYCIAYFVTDNYSLTYWWSQHITNDLFLPGMTVQGAIENSRSHLNEDRERLHYFTSLKKNLVLSRSASKQSYSLIQ